MSGKRIMLGWEAGRMCDCANCTLNKGISQRVDGAETRLTEHYQVSSWHTDVLAQRKGRKEGSFLFLINIKIQCIHHVLCP